jgi:chemotaxis protein methyltransferase CheR
MLLEERGVEGVEILASDVSERRLEQGEAGSYSQFEVQQGLPARRLVRFFSNRDDGFVVEAELRRQIRWERMNLLEPQPAAGAFDLILCRYLLASLVVSARQAVIGSLARSLRPEGRLVLGADERPPAASGLVAVAGAPGVFQRRDAVRAAA